MTNAKRTPTPWHVSQSGSHETEIRSESGRRVAATWVQGQAKSREAALMQAQTNEANAAHIVKCVNMHDELVEVLKDIQDFLKRSGYDTTMVKETLKKAGAL